MLVRFYRLCIAALLGFIVAAQPASGQASVSYQPPILPVKISLNSQGEVSLSVEEEVQTPIGTFSIGAETPLIENGSTLTIVTHDHQFVYRLAGRPFKVTLPPSAKEGMIRYDGRGNTVAYLYDVSARPNSLRTATERRLAQAVLEAHYCLADGSVTYEGLVKFHAGIARSVKVNDDYEAKIKPDLTAFTDLNGDGHMDALAVMDIRYGDDAAQTYLYPVIQHGASLVAGNPVSLGFGHTIIRAVSAHSDLVMADVVVQGPNDPGCCPTLHILQNFKYERGDLREIHDEPNAWPGPRQ